ncbi:hypothetical protein [Nocardia salmonicida]|uniref:hypothetical protein n=1 Tax=Nocardia salmonicida TaxID=53431 RepID=UPI0037A03398
MTVDGVNLAAPGVVDGVVDVLYSPSMDEIEMSGEFWDRTEMHRSRGALRRDEEDGKIRLGVETWIKRDATNRVIRSEGQIAIEHGGGPADHISDFKPRTVYGISDDGVELSLFRAQGGGDGVSLFRDYGQDYGVGLVVIGAHLEGHGNCIGVRFRFKYFPFAHLVDEGCDLKSTGGGGHLAIVDDSNDCWIELRFNSGIAVEDVGSIALYPCITFARTILGVDLEPVEIQVRVNEHHWLDWVSGHRHRAQKGRLRPLADRKDITVDHLGAWVDLCASTDGLVTAVADFDGSAAIEAQTMVLCSIAEGVHRKLFRQSVEYPELTKAQLRAVRRTMREAGMEALRGYGIDDQERFNRLNGPLSMIGDAKYKVRMSELQEVSDRYFSEITSQFDDWPTAMQKARNDLIHSLDIESDTEPTPEQRETARRHLENLMLAATSSAIWVLKGVYFNAIGLSPEVILNRLGSRDAYWFAVANIADFLSGHPCAAASSVDEAADADDRPSEAGNLG